MRYVTKIQSAFLLPLDIAILRDLWYPCWVKGDDENAKKQSDPVRLLHEKWRDNYRFERGLRSCNNFQRISERQQLTANRKADGVRGNPIYR